MNRPIIHEPTSSGFANQEFPTYEIVRYRQNFREEIIQLQKYLWGPDLSLNSAYLEWKYQNNPYLDDRYIFLALCDGKPVGMIGVYGSQWEIGKDCQPWVVPCFGDLAIHPDHRQMGLFPKMVNFAIEELAKTNYTYIFDWGGKEVAFSLMMRGWRPIRFLQTGFWTKRDRHSWSIGRYINNLPFGDSLYRRMRRVTKRLNVLPPSERESSFYRLDKVNIRTCGRTSSRVSISKSPRPAEMDQLVKSNCRNGHIRHVKDAQYFGWRFQNPLSQYRFLFCENSALEGYLVLQSFVDTSWQTQQINIVDWEASSIQVWSDLLQVAIKQGGFSTLLIWSQTLSEAQKTILEHLNFSFRNPTGKMSHDCEQPMLLTRPIQSELFQSDWTEKAKDILTLTNWELRMIYSDDF